MSFLIENGVLKKYTNDDNLTDVIIPRGVTGIGANAFQYADNIVTVTVPNGVKIIGNFAFSECGNLTKAILPESIIHIGASAFSKCGKLAEINTLGKITMISASAFEDCFSLALITIPESVTYIGQRAFDNCKQITSLKLPDSLEIIENQAFASCENLTDFSIPANVKEIRSYAFVGCKKLYKITLPRNLSAIEEGTFASCEGLTEIRIPYGVGIIRNSAFNHCVNLSKVNIPASVAQIELFAFSSCHSLRKLTIPQNGIDIMFNTFFQCENLTTNLPIKEWNSIWGIDRLDYALHYMRNFKAGDPFFEKTKEENKRYIKRQLHNILKKDANAVIRNPSDKDPFGIRPNDTDLIVFLIDEFSLSIDEVEALMDKVQGNPEASAILLDYRRRNFSEEFLEKHESDKLQKELGLKERTVEEWKKIFRLGDDGNSGYMILGSKGKDANVEIPEKIGKRPVTAINNWAFSPIAPRITQALRNARNSLETIIIPDSVTAIGLNVFEGCVRLNSIVYRGRTFTPNEFEDYRAQNIPKPAEFKENY